MDMTRASKKLSYLLRHDKDFIDEHGWARVTAVSYTHLDVYKRQGMGGLKEELAGVERIEEIARIISRHTGAECVPEEDGFLLTYNRGKGCDCSIVRAGYVHSPVFCNCTLGFHQKVWSTIFERPVRVELVETFLRGGNCCSQKVFIK